MKIPLQRAIGVTTKGFWAIQRQMQELQEQMHRGMYLIVMDESEDEREEGKMD